MAIAAEMGWKIHQMDVKTSFLNGLIEEEVYIEQPHGFEVFGRESHMCLLKKALYSLKQTPRAWYSRIDSYLLTNRKSILLVEYSKNTFACELMEGTIQDGKYKVVDDIIYYKDRIYLVLESTLKDKILRAVHDAPLARHPEISKDLQEGEGDILLEGSQGGCTTVCEGVLDLSAKQFRA
jgi:hypothetical protein